MECSVLWSPFAHCWVLALAAQQAISGLNLPPSPHCLPGLVPVIPAFSKLSFLFLDQDSSSGKWGLLQWLCVTKLLLDWKALCGRSSRLGKQSEIELLSIFWNTEDFWSRKSYWKSSWKAIPLPTSHKVLFQPEDCSTGRILPKFKLQMKSQWVTPQTLTHRDP